MIVTLIPAAGASSRMRGRDKLLETVGGEPILRRTAKAAIEADIGPVVVTLPPEASERRKILRDLDLTVLEITDHAEGMAASLRAGAAWALPRLLSAPDPDSYAYHGLLVLLPDMPGPTALDLRGMESLYAARGGPVVRGSDATGRPGHPVLLPVNLVHEFAGLRGDHGAAELLEGERTVLLPLTGDRATRDLDTPEDWAAWRTENP